MKNFKKSTIQEIQTMIKWHQEGISTAEISRRLRKDRSSIYYWLSRNPNYSQGKSGRRLLLKVPKLKWHGVSIDKLIEKKNTEKEIRNSGKCIFCGKEKSEKWKRTYFCGIKCWSDKYLKLYSQKSLYGRIVQGCG